MAKKGISKNARREGAQELLSKWGGKIRMKSVFEKPASGRFFFAPGSVGLRVHGLKRRPDLGQAVELLLDDLLVVEISGFDAPLLVCPFLKAFEPQRRGVGRLSRVVFGVGPIAEGSLVDLFRLV